ncbi:MAG: septal ring lytic transglycosylase RlpA family protein [Rhodobiaceae bacterium]|nr:septal ring lytic transglycosylase RlpA family protein [Rhodobiaceae bacterium]
MQRGRNNSLRVVSVVVAAGLLAACGSLREGSTVDPKLGVSASQRVVDTNKPIPKGGGVFKVGRPYKVAGKWYYPREDTSYDEVGVASWYGDDFHGRQTANGEIYDMHALSAAHPTMPLPTYARVTNLANGRSVVVRVNDRGPYAHDRLIDLSAKTAEVLGFTHHGTTKVRVQYVGRAPLEGDDTWLTTTYAEGGQVAPIPSSRLASDTPAARGTLRPQQVSAITSTGSIPQSRPDGMMAAFAPDWIDSGNRVADAFAAIDTDHRRRDALSAGMESFLRNDPVKTSGH